jgi:hypothetical protein
MNVYWLIALIPTWVIFTLLIAGAVGLFVAFFVGRIPFIKQYNFPIKLVSTILLICGVYLQGAAAYKQSVAVEVAELKVKLAEAEAKGAKTNTEIVEKIVKDTQVIREKGRTITEYVDREVIKYNNRCELPAEVINAHNAAATLDPSKLEGEKK